MIASCDSHQKPPCMREPKLCEADEQQQAGKKQRRVTPTAWTCSLLQRYETPLHVHGQWRNSRINQAPAAYSHEHGRTLLSIGRMALVSLSPACRGFHPAPRGGYCLGA